MKLFKNSLSIILAVLMMLSVCIVPAVAVNVNTELSGRKMDPFDATGQIGDNCSWGFYESTGEMYISGEGKMSGNVYDSYLKDYRTKIKSVMVRDGVTSICNAAFQNCTNLESVGMGSSSVTEIGANAFYGCTSLKEVSFPYGLVSIGDTAFMSTALEKVELYDTVTTFGTKCLGYKNASTKVENFEIEGYSGSAAYDYAAANGFKFTPIGTEEAVKSLNVNFAVPQAGFNLGDEAYAFNVELLSSGSIHIISELDVEWMNWTDAETGDVLSTADCFEFGKTYTFELHLKAGDGYKFALDEDENYIFENILINGKAYSGEVEVNKIDGYDPSKYAALKITAKDSTEVVKITYDLNGGSFAESVQQDVKDKVDENGICVFYFPKGNHYFPEEVIPPEGKIFDYYEFNGFKTEDYYIFTNNDITIKYIWKDAPVDKPTEPVATAPSETTPAVTEPAATQPDNTTPSTPKAASKKSNPIKVTAKTKTVKAKKLKKKAQKIKPFTVKNAQGKVSYKLVKSGITKKIRKLVSVNSKGVITIKKWKKAKKGTYKIKVKITAAGNTSYNAKTITKTIKVKVK